MGQEIDRIQFTRRDFQASAARVAKETALLRQWFQEGVLSAEGGIGGFELEAWLVNERGLPSPSNDTLIRRLQDPMVVPELAKFNVEFNVDPQTLGRDGLSRLHEQLMRHWHAAEGTANDIGAALMTIGILPTVTEADLTPTNMSEQRRYKVLNQQVLRSRLGRPLRLDIVGREHLQTSHTDVMLESAATSFQIHLQVAAHEARRYYNAAIIVSAPMVALSVNSPYLFGCDLWDETRIPLFEQAVEVGGYEGASQGPIRRVTFGSGYVRDSLAECFIENLEHYPVLLPNLFDEPVEKLAHLRLHNGTIWRWNRPLIGFDAEGRPHLRIEHRVVPAGPTIDDCIANSAVFFGLSTALSNQPVAPESQLSFPQARDNFYAAARHGLAAQVKWLDGTSVTMATLLLEEILPLARRGLTKLGVDGDAIDHYVGIVEARVRSRQTGAAWQRAFVESHGRDMASLTHTYLENQRQGCPVHQWDLQACR